MIYATWRRFREAIQRAILACQNSGQEPADHLTIIGNMVRIGSGARQPARSCSMMLSRSSRCLASCRRALKIPGCIHSVKHDIAVDAAYQREVAILEMW